MRNIHAFARHLIGQAYTFAVASWSRTFEEIFNALEAESNNLSAGDPQWVKLVQME